MSNQAERNSVVQHTTEPWVVEKAHDIDAIAWVGQFAVLPQDHTTRVVRGNTEDDARRIVACVNACAGIDTESLEADGYGDNWAEIAKHRIELMGQRDELLVALQAMVLFTAPNKSNAAALSNALQLIAKHTGGAVVEVYECGGCGNEHPVGTGVCPETGYPESTKGGTE